MNGTELMKELRKLASEDKLDEVEGIRLALAALADITENQHMLEKVVETEIKKLRDFMKDNPMFKVGIFITSNKKIFWILVALVFILSNLWFVPELRGGLALLLVPLGFPAEWATFLSGN